MADECAPPGARVATVIGASAILAYLFIPFQAGTKPQFKTILGHFLTALSTVLVCTFLFD